MPVCNWPTSVVCQDSCCWQYWICIHPFKPLLDECCGSIHRRCRDSINSLVWPVEVSWLLTNSILKFWKPDTKVEDESLQVVFPLQNLQNIRFPSESYVSHVKSFNHDRTNFRFDEDWDVEESSIALFEVEVVDVWDDSEDFDDDRNALISILNESNHAWHFKMADKRFLIALHHGYVTWSHVSSIKKVNMAANEHGLVTKQRIIFWI